MAPRKDRYAPKQQRTDTGTAQTGASAGPQPGTGARPAHPQIEQGGPHWKALSRKRSARYSLKAELQHRLTNEQKGQALPEGRTYSPPAEAGGGKRAPLRRGSFSGLAAGSARPCRDRCCCYCGHGNVKFDAGVAAKSNVGIYRRDAHALIFSFVLSSLSL